MPQPADVTATTPAPLSDAPPGPTGLNVRDFGAVGDGLHDDTEAIEAACGAAGPSGTVLFPPGSYRITRTLTLLTDQVWAGSGALMGNTTPACQLVSEVHDAPLLVAVHGSLVHLRLSGPGLASPASVGVQVAGSARIRDVEIWDFGTGLDLEKSWYTNIDHVYLRFNQLAVRITYCYNVNVFDIRIHARLRDGSHGEGIELRDRAMVTFHGGSIEQYATGVRLGGSCSAAFIGTYFESHSHHCDGVLVRDPGCTVTVSACQVYLDNHRGWISIEASQAVLNANGNIFKSSNPHDRGQVLAYQWGAAAAPLTAVLMGDSWAQVRHQGFGYRPRSEAACGLVVDPVGSPRGGPVQHRVSTSVPGWRGAMMRVGAWLGLVRDDPGPRSGTSR